MKQNAVPRCPICGSDMVATWKVLVPWRLRKYNAVCGGCHNYGPIAFTHSGAIKNFAKRGRKKPHGEKRRTLDRVQGNLR